MKYTGTIEIKDGFSLTNPTMVSQGIKDAMKINEVTQEETFDFKYLEVYFTEPNNKLVHSRYWVIGDGVTEEEAITSNDVLNRFV